MRICNGKKNTNIKGVKIAWAVVLMVASLLVMGCGGKSGSASVKDVKKSHFAQAPKITVEELVKRYQFIDSSSINWSQTTDSNNNEYAEVSASFDDTLSIVFNHIQENINSGMMDVSVFMNIEHEFFNSLLNEKGFKVEDDSSSYASLRFNMFEPDYGNPNAPIFFNCNGGTITLDFTVDKNRIAKIEKATLIFDMQSPMKYSGEVAKYQLIYPIEAEIAEVSLVNNTDIKGE
jgi:ABC-type Fe3+-citrate transport system substrate-binding protein